jgi:serine/threonine-protein kinase
MSLPSDKYARLSDATAVDPADPFDVTDRAQPAPPRETQLSQLSDPPTAVARRDSFRELATGTIVGENYEIETKLGAGAMGEVYAARHVRLGKRVAVKVIGKRLSEDEAAIERFAMEARTLAQIQHPAIVAVEHVGELTDGRAFFVMEFLRGQSLFERLQHGRLSLSEALRVIDQIARGLDAAHAEGIIHRDLKPENTFLVHLPGEPPAVKLVDFGLAKLAEDRAGLDRRAERTQSGVAIGTPMYMSPEQARGPDVDHKTDIYALGCVAYELILGQPPFPHARTGPELFAAHLVETPPLPRTIWPEIPQPLDQVLFGMLAKEPDQRPTLAQVRAVIADTAASLQPLRAPTADPVAVTPKVRFWKVAIGAIAVIALVVGIAIGASMRSDGAQVPAPMPDAAPPIQLEQPAAPPAPAEVKAPIAPISTVETDLPAKKQAPKPRVTKVVRPVPAQAPGVDAGVEAKPVDESKTKPVVPDRDRAVNPFAKKRKETP